ncbi:tRNA (5-methylaminomethyl-2-thiouridine)(34)-methyltransferase MnmD [bacterium]|nr:tRNA (5-methylaminomethyl-2-thiouridine)(34)-methyltransferase MnmD [bacterium]
MAGGEQAEGLDWRDGIVPVSRRFDDPYFSLAGGLAETRHVFLTGNGLPERLRPGFHIAELGFGTGLNLLATHLLAPDMALHYTSFEAFPISAAAMAQSHAAFPEAAAVSAPLVAAWAQGQRRFTLGAITVEVIEADARTALPLWSGRADAWYLDGFSPAKNPELWGEALMAEVARHTAKGGTFATYTAAGHVRRALQAAGFHVTRAKGFGTKRHMSTGVLS